LYPEEDIMASGAEVTGEREIMHNDKLHKMHCPTNIT